MKEKFKWDKFIADCIICFSIVIVSPFIFFYPMNWVLTTLPMNWILTTSLWNNICVVFGIIFPIIVSLLILNIFYKIYKPSLIFSCATSTLFAVCVDIILRFYFIK